MVERYTWLQQKRRSLAILIFRQFPPIRCFMHLCVVWSSEAMLHWLHIHCIQSARHTCTWWLNVWWNFTLIILSAELLPLVQGQWQEGWWVILPTVQGGPSKGETGTGTRTRDCSNRDRTWEIRLKPSQIPVPILKVSFFTLYTHLSIYCAPFISVFSHCMHAKKNSCQTQHYTQLSSAKVFSLYSFSMSSKLGILFSSRSASICP